MKTTRMKTLAVIAVIIALVITACSTQKNTAQTRWWHSFNARYNTYFNGSQAYIDASLEKEKGNKDNFTEIIPLYTVGNKNSRQLGSGNYDRAIEKCEKAIKLHSIKRKPEWTKRRRKTARDIAWLNRKEYNPFLWKAWMLMGRSQFYKGAFDEAAATFSYMSRLYQTQPAIYAKARAWLAKCYIEQDWVYDAEDVIRNMQRDSIDWRATKEWNYTFADYYIHTGNYEQAVPYLKKVIKREMRKVQKAREWYLLGQIYTQLGQKDNAYKAFKSVIRQNPPFELEFNARIAMTEVLSDRNAKQMISRLKRMSWSDKNKDYLDQVYYAIGNIYLSQRDTMQAIAAYEKGNEKSTRNGIEKGVLLLKLGDIYWDLEKYSDAQRCYGTAIGLLDKERKDYKQLSDRSKMLDELVPYTDAVHLQDSLQELANMSEEERNKAIDRVIEALKKKEKEERRAQQEQEAAEMMQKNGAAGSRNQNAPQQQANQQQNGVWYFYNQMAIAQGKAAFEKQWGKRENVDDWQRVNKTVVGGLNNEEELSQEALDSIAAAEALQDSLNNVADSAQNDPHKREYYLAQIPFTEEQILASNLIIQDGLFHSGIIFKDKFDNLPLSEKQFNRLTSQYPDFEQMDEVYYHLYLLYSRKQQFVTANDYVELLKNKYPESKWTKLLADPYFKENAQFGEQIEDSLYAATYEAFKADRYNEVAGNSYISETRFPLGANRDKFIFISGLSQLNSGNATACVENMEKIIKEFPQSRISEMAGMIVNGVRAGKRLHGGKFDIGDIWDRRSVELNNGDSTAVKKFVADRNVSHTFLLVYNPDSISENQTLFELAKFNFTNYIVRNFEITIDELEGLHRMLVTGFQNYDEAHLYARQLYENKALAQKLKKARGIVISDKNLPLLGTNFSYKEYDEYYNKHFAPLPIENLYLLTEPTEIAVEKEKESPRQEEEEESELIEDGATYGEEFFTDTEETPTQSIAVPEPTENNQQETQTTIVENAEENADVPAADIPARETNVTVSEDAEQQEPVVQPQPQAEAEAVSESETILPEESQTVVSEEKTAEPVVTQEEPLEENEYRFDEETQPATNNEDNAIESNTEVSTDNGNITTEDDGYAIDDDDDGFIFDDEDTGVATDDEDFGINQDNNNSNKKNNDDDFDVDDEYFELDGF